MTAQMNALNRENRREQILASLPGFLMLRLDQEKQVVAIEVDTQKLQSSAEFRAFLDRFFTANAYFVGLDYALFSRLAFEFVPGAAADKAGPQRLAADIQFFEQDRFALYHEPRVLSGEMEYLFEPVYLEVEREIALSEEAIAAGEAPQTEIVSEPAQLNLDEFIAFLWQRGIKFGVDCDAIRGQLASKRCERVVIARQRQSTFGSDAEIKEESRDLHRDNAPRVLPNGKVDLGGYRNRFPQVVAEQRLVSKVPRVLGKQGFDLHGNTLEPDLPQDIDLNSLAGPGTKVVMLGQQECLVTSKGGFLSIDTASGQFSVDEKIINREGVNARTTGDLTLDGEEYEEYGEIQEKRQLKGKTITVHADVYGEIVSTGGTVTLKHNIVGGSVTCAKGAVVVEGLASGATLVVKEGEIHVKRAENCLLIAPVVRVSQAILCDIVADQVVIDEAEGCTMAAKSFDLAVVSSRAQAECQISILVPDINAFRAQESALAEAMAECDTQLAQIQGQLTELQTDTALKAYVGLAGRVQRKLVVLDAEQNEKFRSMGIGLAPKLRALSALREAMMACEAAKLGMAEQAAKMAEAEIAAAQGLGCRIGILKDEPRVLTMPVKADAPPLASLPAKELRLALRASIPGAKVITVDCEADFEWHYGA